MDGHKKFWLGLNLVKGIGPVKFKALLNHFGTAQAAWEAAPAALMGAGLSQKIINSMLKVRADVDLQKIIDNIAAKDISILTWQSDDYPRHLKEINQSPPVIYIRGNLLPADEWAIGVVGTRRVTKYGRQVAEDLGAFLAHNGLTVVSGLARGVDTIAQQAALNAGGRTLSILGNGVDVIYPPENRDLAKKITKNGALISDYPPGTPPDKNNFPPRNRLISGLCMGVVIVEAGQRSGALITASYAADQGKEVFAVPGNIYGTQSKGPNTLIQKGAVPLLKPEDILEVLKLQKMDEHQAVQAVLPANAEEAALYTVLNKEPQHIDDIRRQTSLSIEQVSSTLVLMELKGLIKQVGNMHYVSIHETPASYDSKS